MQTNMNLVKVYIAIVRAPNVIAHPFRKPAMLQRKMGREPKQTRKTFSPSITIA